MTYKEKKRGRKPKDEKFRSFSGMGYGRWKVHRVDDKGVYLKKS